MKIRASLLLLIIAAAFAQGGFFQEWPSQFYDNFTADANVDWNYSQAINISNGVHTSFIYKQEINITERSGTTLTDFQVSINITYDSNMKPDFSDLRFTWLDPKAGKEISIPYYVESKVDGAWAYVWLKVPFIPANGTTTIYMYFGNASAASESSASQVFDFYDGFETWNGWVQYSGVVSQSSDRAYRGIYSLKKDLYGDPNGGYKDLGFTLNYPFVLEAWVYRSNSQANIEDDRIGIIDTSGNGYGIVVSHSYTSGTGLVQKIKLPNLGIERRTAYSATIYNETILQTAYALSNVWYSIRFVWDNGSMKAEVYKDGNLVTSTSLNDLNYSSFARVYVFGGYPYYVDELRIRKYAPVMPSVSFGAIEEIAQEANLVTKPISTPYTITRFANLSVNVSGNVSFYLANANLSIKELIGTANGPTTFDLSSVDPTAFGKEFRILANFTNASIYAINLTWYETDIEGPTFNYIGDLEGYNMILGEVVGSDPSGIEGCNVSLDGIQIQTNLSGNTCAFNITGSYTQHNLTVCLYDIYGNKNCSTYKVTLKGLIDKNKNLHLTTFGYYDFNVDFTGILNVSSNATFDFKRHLFNGSIFSNAHAIVLNAVVSGRNTNFTLNNASLNVTNVIKPNPSMLDYGFAVSLNRLGSGSYAIVNVSIPDPRARFWKYNGSWHLVRTSKWENGILTSGKLTSFSTLVPLVDTAAPVVSFVNPTPGNNSFIGAGNILIKANVRDNSIIDTVILRVIERDVFGNPISSNDYVMDTVGSETSVNATYTLSITGSNYSIEYYVIANDSSGNVGMSEHRFIHVPIYVNLPAKLTEPGIYELQSGTYMNTSNSSTYVTYTSGSTTFKAAVVLDNNIKFSCGIFSINGIINTSNAVGIGISGENVTIKNCIVNLTIFNNPSIHMLGGIGDGNNVFLEDVSIYLYNYADSEHVGLWTDGWNHIIHGLYGECRGTPCNLAVNTLIGKFMGNEYANTLQNIQAVGTFYFTEINGALLRNTTIHRIGGSYTSTMSSQAGPNSSISFANDCLFGSTNGVCTFINQSLFENVELWSKNATISSSTIRNLSIYGGNTTIYNSNIETLFIEPFIYWSDQVNTNDRTVVIESSQLNGIKDLTKDLGTGLIGYTINITSSNISTVSVSKLFGYNITVEKGSYDSSLLPSGYFDLGRTLKIKKARNTTAGILEELAYEVTQSELSTYNSSPAYLHFVKFNESGYYELPTMVTEVPSRGPGHYEVYLAEPLSEFSNISLFAESDDDPPLVKIVYPTPGYYTSNVTLIKVNATDPAGVDKVIAEVDSGSQNAYNVTLAFDGTYWYNDTVNIGEGDHRIRIYAYDVYGNLNNTEYVDFTVLPVTLACDGSGLYVKYDVYPKNPLAGADVLLYGIVCNNTQPLANKDVWFFWENKPVDGIIVKNWTFENATRSDPTTARDGWTKVGDFVYNFALSWGQNHEFDWYFGLGHLSKYSLHMYNSFADPHGYLYRSMNYYADAITFDIKYASSAEIYGQADRISAVVTLADGTKLHFILHNYSMPIPSNTTTDYYFDYRNDSYLGVWRPVVIPLFEIQKMLHPGIFYNVTNLSFEIETSGYDSEHGASIGVDNIYLYDYSKIKTSGDGSFAKTTKAPNYVRNITSYVHVDYNTSSPDILQNSTQIEVGSAFTISMNLSNNNIQPGESVTLSGQGVYANGNNLSSGLPVKVFVDGAIQSETWYEIAHFDFETGTQGWDYFGNSPGYETNLLWLSEGANHYLSVQTNNTGGWRTMAGLSFYLPPHPGYIDVVKFQFKPMEDGSTSFMTITPQIDDRGIERNLHLILHSKNVDIGDFKNDSENLWINLANVPLNTWQEFEIHPYEYGKELIGGKKIFRLLFIQNEKSSGNLLQFGIDDVSFLEGLTTQTQTYGKYSYGLDTSSLSAGGHWVSVEITDEQGVTGTNKTYLQVLPVIINIISPENMSMYKTVWLNVTSNSYMQAWSYELDGNWYSLTPGDPGVGQTGFSIQLTGLSEGIHKVKVNGTTLSGAYNETDYVYFIVDNTPPRIYLISPPNNSFVDSMPFNFSFKAIDGLSSIMDCSLHTNSTTNPYVTFIQNVLALNDTIVNVSVSLPDDKWLWYVECSDDAGNTNKSEIWYLTTDTNPPGIFINSTTMSTDIHYTGYVGYTNEPTNITPSFYSTSVWWNSQWKYRMPIPPSTRSSYLYGSFTMDTSLLIDEGKMNPDCSDLRVIGTYFERDVFGNDLGFKTFVLPFNLTNCNSTETKIYFRAPYQILNSTRGTIFGLQNVMVYYGNPNAEVPIFEKILMPNISGLSARYPDIAPHIDGRYWMVNVGGYSIQLYLYDTKVASFNNTCTSPTIPEVVYNNGYVYIGYDEWMLKVNASNYQLVDQYHVYSERNIVDLGVLGNKLVAISVDTRGNYYVDWLEDDGFNVWISQSQPINIPLTEVPPQVKFVEPGNGSYIMAYDRSETKLWKVDLNTATEIGAYPGYVFYNAGRNELEYANLSTVPEFTILNIYNLNGNKINEYTVDLWPPINLKIAKCDGNLCFAKIDLNVVEEIEEYNYLVYGDGKAHTYSTQIEEPKDVLFLDSIFGHRIVYSAYGSIKIYNFITPPETAYGLAEAQAAPSDLDQIWYILKNSSGIVDSGLIDPSKPLIQIPALEDGNYTLEIYANDTFGHKSQVDMRLIYDTIPPTITASVTHQGDYILVDYTANDPNLDVCNWYINGTPIGTIPCSGTLNITPEMVGTGTFNITISSVDKAENSNSTSVVANIGCITPKDDFTLNSIYPFITLKICPGNYSVTDKQNDGIFKLGRTHTLIDCQNSNITGNGTLVNGSADLVNCHFTGISYSSELGGRIENVTFVNASYAPGWGGMFSIYCPDCILQNVNFTNSPIYPSIATAVNVNYNGKPMLIDTNAQNKVIRSNNEYGAIYLFNTNNTTIEVNLTNGGYLAIVGIGTYTRNVVINNSNISNSLGILAVDTGSYFYPSTLVENTYVTNNKFGFLLIPGNLQSAPELKVVNSLVDGNELMAAGNGYIYGGMLGTDNRTGVNIIGGPTICGSYWQDIGGYDSNGDGILTSSLGYVEILYAGKTNVKPEWELWIDDDCPLANETYMPEPTNESDWISVGHDLANTYSSPENGAPNYIKLFEKESYAPPVIAKGILFTIEYDPAGFGDYELVASDPNTGRELWRKITWGANVLFYHGGLICASSVGGGFWNCFEPLTGKMVAQGYGGSPVVINGTIFSFDSYFIDGGVGTNFNGYNVSEFGTQEFVEKYSFSGNTYSVFGDGIFYYVIEGKPSTFGYINRTNYSDNGTYAYSLKLSGDLQREYAYAPLLHYYNGNVYFGAENTTTGRWGIYMFNKKGVSKIIDVDGQISQLWVHDNLIEFINYTTKYYSSFSIYYPNYSTHVVYNITSGNMSLVESYPGMLYYTLNSDGSIKIMRNVSYSIKTKEDVCGNTVVLSNVTHHIGGKEMPIIKPAYVDIPHAFVWQNKTYIWIYDESKDTPKVEVYGERIVTPVITVWINNKSVDQLGNKFPFVGPIYELKVHLADELGSPLPDIPVTIKEVDGNSAIATESGDVSSSITAYPEPNGNLSVLVIPTKYGENVNYRVNISAPGATPVILNVAQSSHVKQGICKYKPSWWGSILKHANINNVSNALSAVRSRYVYYLGLENVENRFYRYNISINTTGNISLSDNNVYLKGAFLLMNISNPYNYMIMIESTGADLFAGTQYNYSGIIISNETNITVAFVPIPLGGNYEIKIKTYDGSNLLDEKTMVGKDDTPPTLYKESNLSKAEKESLSQLSNQLSSIGRISLYLLGIWSCK